MSEPAGRLREQFGSTSCLGTSPLIFLQPAFVTSRKTNYCRIKAFAGRAASASRCVRTCVAHLFSICGDYAMDA
eukprot:scaffold88514_cov32-Tisochrysis_lutea.AAC.1